jgi:hypothetical protein
LPPGKPRKKGLMFYAFTAFIFLDTVRVRGEAGSSRESKVWDLA